jgi:hypothetical protein
MKIDQCILGFQKIQKMTSYYYIHHTSCWYDYVATGRKNLEIPGLKRSQAKIVCLVLGLRVRNYKLSRWKPVTHDLPSHESADRDSVP